MSKTDLVSTKQHVRSSFRDAVYTNLNIGMAESYFCAFMLALGISEITAGFGTVLAQFIGVLFQLLSIRTFFRRHPIKKRLLLFLGIQALTMIPLIFIGKYQINSSYLVIGVLGLYWASLLSLNPPWNRLMGHTIPAKFRLSFFTIRNQFGQSSVFLGLLISGTALYLAGAKEKELEVFVYILGAGLILKCLSWSELKFNHNGYENPGGIEQRLRLRDFIKRLRHTEQGKLITFLFFFYIGVNFASPYFAPYMLGHLKFNYLQYMGVTATSYFGRIFMFRVLQKRAKSRHINLLLLCASIGIATSPLMWSLSNNYAYILSIEFLSGCYWAGFELSTILLYYQKIEDHERTSVMSYITFFNITGMVIGSLLGSIYMKQLPPQWDPYLILFITSSCLRTLVIIFTPHVNFRGQIPKLISFNRVFMVLPPFGALTRPIIGKIKKKEEEKEKK